MTQDSQAMVCLDHRPSFESFREDQNPIKLSIHHHPLAGG